MEEGHFRPNWGSKTPTPTTPSVSIQRWVVTRYCWILKFSSLITISVELKKGKATGFDGISAEHISHANPILVVHLTLLFRLHGLVLDDFGQGFVITLKNPDGNRFVSDNCRWITLAQQTCSQVLTVRVQVQVLASQVQVQVQVRNLRVQVQVRDSMSQPVFL